MRTVTGLYYPNIKKTAQTTAFFDREQPDNSFELVDLHTGIYMPENHVR